MSILNKVMQCHPKQGCQDHLQDRLARDLRKKSHPVPLQPELVSFPLDDLCGLAGCVNAALCLPGSTMRDITLHMDSASSIACTQG